MAVLVVAGVMVQDGRYLLSQRLPHVHMPLTWEFPGGKVIEGENPDQALVRELGEELGIQIDSYEPWWFVNHPYNEFHLAMLLYHVRSWRGEVQPLCSCRLDWFSVDDMTKIIMPPADLPIVERLRNYPL